MVDISVHPKTKAVFKILVTTSVGDGKTTLFWTDRRLLARSIKKLASGLFPFGKKRAKARRMKHYGLWVCLVTWLVAWLAIQA